MAGDEDFEIPETGAVFTFGRSRFAENQSSHFFIRNDPVVKISCGDEHTALICAPVLHVLRSTTDLHLEFLAHLGETQKIGLFHEGLITYTVDRYRKKEEHYEDPFS